MRRLWLAVILVGLVGCTSTSDRPQDRQKSAEINAQLGLRYMQQGKNDVALEKLKRALDQDSKSAIAHLYIAELYRRLDETSLADRHYRKSIDSDPQNSSAYNNYGAFLCGQKRYEEAEKQFQKVLKNPVYPDRAGTFENMGLCMRDSGDVAKAEDYFRKALQLEPRMRESLLAMAEISFSKGSALSARGYLQRYGEVSPHIPRYLWLGVRVERALGDMRAAEGYGMMLRKNFPDSQEAALYLKGTR